VAIDNAVLKVVGDDVQSGRNSVFDESYTLPDESASPLLEEEEINSPSGPRRGM
jgi:hypothetical protein